MGCGPAVPEGKTAAGGKLVCENEFHLDALNVSGGGGFAALRIDGSVETKAIRQINDSVVSYGVQAKRLCEEFNGGVLTREEYSTRSENLRRRLAGVPELHDKLESAAKSNDMGAQKKALYAAYEGLVPDEQRSDLSLEFTTDIALPDALDGVPATPCAQKIKRGDAKIISHGDSVPSGALMSFRARTSKPAYVYLFQQNEMTKEITTLFPSSRIPIAEPVPPDKVVRIPHETAGFCVNEKDLGMERVYVVASLTPVERLEKFASGGQSSQSKTLGLEGLSTGRAAKNECPRALELVDTAGPCVRGRGLVLQDDAKEERPTRSFRAVAEAGDSTIVKVFAFEHVSPNEFQKRGPKGVLGSARGIMIEE